MPYGVWGEAPKTPGIIKGPQPLNFLPASATCAPKRMKTGGFRSYHIRRTGAPQRDRRMSPPLVEMAATISSKRRSRNPLNKKRPHGVTTRAKDGQKAMGLYDSQVQNTSQRVIAKGASTLPPA